MFKKFVTVVMSLLIMTSIFPAATFADQGIYDFNNIRSCRILSYVEPVAKSEYASYFDLSLIDKTKKELEDMTYDSSKSYEENEAIIFACCSNFYEQLFNQYKSAMKEQLEKTKSDSSDFLVGIINESIKELDNLKFIYDRDKKIDEYMTDINFITNDCKLAILAETNSSDINKTKLISSLKLTVKKTKGIQVKFNIADKFDAKINKYQIYRSTSKNFKKNLKKYTANLKDVSKNTLTYTNSKSLKKGTKYFYKVRGVVTNSNGKPIYTKWSATKNVKYK